MKNPAEAGFLTALPGAGKTQGLLPVGKGQAAAGLNAVVAPEPVFDRDVPKGAVAGQDPATGNLTKGGAVTLTISKGPKLVDVPNVFRKSEEEAVQVLKDAGFEVKVNYAFGSSVLGLVAGQDKTGRQPEGSLITIAVT